VREENVIENAEMAEERKVEDVKQDDVEMSEEGKPTKPRAQSPVREPEMQQASPVESVVKDIPENNQKNATNLKDVFGPEDSETW
jgi:hypothetical protein